MLGFPGCPWPHVHLACTHHAHQPQLTFLLLQIHVALHPAFPRLGELQAKGQDAALSGRGLGGDL